MDHVIAEAKQQGVRLLLALVNNLQAFGGKTQYVKWAWEEGLGLTSSNDSFFYDPSIRRYFKHYLKVAYMPYQSHFHSELSWLLCLYVYVGQLSKI